MKDELCRYEASWTMYPWSSGNRAKLHRDREMLKSLKGKVEVSVPAKQLLAVFLTGSSVC